MGSLGVAECHFILEETGAWGLSSSRSISCFPVLSSPASIPLHGHPPTPPRPASCKLLLNPQNPTQAFPPLLGGVP